MPRKSFSCRIISAPTGQPRSTKLFPPPKQGGSSSVSNGITRQSTAAGSIWRNPSSASFRPSASIGVSHKQTLIDEIAAWEDDRNVNHAKADWQFTSADARIKLKYLYPSI